MIKVLDVVLKLLAQITIVFSLLYYVFNISHEMIVSAVWEYVGSVGAVKVAVFVVVIVALAFFNRRVNNIIISDWAKSHKYSIVKIRKCGLFCSPHPVMWFWSSVVYVACVDEGGREVCAWLNLGFRPVRVEGAVLDEGCGEVD